VVLLAVLVAVLAEMLFQRLIIVADHTQIVPLLLKELKVAAVRFLGQIYTQLLA
jgi:hypothetical protein